MYGGCLNKTFFLCPLDAASRRQYAKESFRLRIIIPSVIFLISNAILMLCGHFFIDIFLIRAFIFGCTAISVNIYAKPDFDKSFSDTKVYPFTGNYETINIYSHMINIVLIIIVIYLNEYTITELAIGEIVLIALCLILQLAITICKVKRFYWQSIILMDFYK